MEEVTNRVDFMVGSPEETGEGPSEKYTDDSLCAKIDKFFKYSKRATEKARQDWLDNYRFSVDGDQWPKDRPKHLFSDVVNLTLAAILQEIGIQTDSRPKVDFRPTEPGDTQFVEMLKVVNDANWEKSAVEGFGWLGKTADALFDCKHADVVFGHVYWDVEASDGIGDIGYDILDPVYCYWDPAATTVKEMRWFIYAKPVPTAVLKAKYPDKAAQIKPDLKVIGMDSDGISSPDIDRYYLGGGRQDVGKIYTKDEEFGGEDMSLLFRVWLQDEALEQGEDENEKVHVLKKKYPKGRYVEKVGKTILKDGHNGAWFMDENVPYEHGLFPIVPLVNYRVPRKLEGINEITHLRGPQRVYNYQWASIIQQQKIQGNPKVVVQTGTIEEPENITNEDGLIIETSDINGIRFEGGTGVTPSAFNILDMAKGAHDTVNGLSEASKGTPQPNVTSGLQLEGYVEAAQTRPRLKNRNLDEYLQGVGYLMLHMYLQFYTAPRVFRLTNAEGFPEYVEFSIEDNMAIASRKVERDGKIVDGGIQKQERKGVPDVVVSSGSALPFAKAQKVASSLQLYDRGAIDIEALLDAIDWPNAKEMARKMEERQAQAAQREAGQPPGGAQG